MVWGLLVRVPDHTPLIEERQKKSPYVMLACYHFGSGRDHLPGENQRFEESTACVAEIPDFVPQANGIMVDNLDREPRAVVLAGIHSAQEALDCKSHGITEVKRRRPKRRGRLTQVSGDGSGRKSSKKRATVHQQASLPD